jgi:ketosteroid isomerase-like protein
MSQENVEVVERGYAAFGRRDVPAMVELLSEDFELDISGHPVPDFPDYGVGAEHFVGFLATYLSGFDDYTLRIMRLMEAGDEIVVLLHDSARIRGSEGIVERDLAHVWTVRAAKLCRLRAYNAHEEALEAVGLSEQDISA